MTIPPEPPTQPMLLLEELPHGYKIYYAAREKNFTHPGIYMYHPGTRTNVPLFLLEDLSIDT